jgi:hypothetical protein
MESYNFLVKVVRARYMSLVPVAALMTLASAAAPSATASIIIDSFSVSSNATVMLGSDTPPAPPVYFGPNGIATASALGGFRMMASYVTAGDEEDLYRFRVSNSTGLASVETSARVKGRGLLTYNGTNTPNTGVSAGHFNPPGSFNLGGIDITQSGANQAVFVNAYADNNGIPIVFTFWTNSSTYARGVLHLPGSSNGALLAHSLAFTNFTPTGGSLNGILSNVNAITIELDGMAPGVTVGTDVVLDYVIAASIPEPATYLTIGTALIALCFVRRRTKG